MKIAKGKKKNTGQGGVRKYQEAVILNQVVGVGLAKMILGEDRGGRSHVAEKRIP